MIVEVLQTAMVGTTVGYDIPDEIAKKGVNAVMDYINEHYDEIPGGNIEPENTFDWQLDEELTAERVAEALKNQEVV